MKETQNSQKHLSKEPSWMTHSSQLRTLYPVGIIKMV